MRKRQGISIRINGFGQNCPSLEPKVTGFLREERRRDVRAVIDFRSTSSRTASAERVARPWGGHHDKREQGAASALYGVGRVEGPGAGGLRRVDSAALTGADR
ncbi:hypothetical protein GCM10009548_88960 [Streptomyces malaysiensis subsp. malaysiensis]